MITPPPLRPGDCATIVSPSSKISEKIRGRVRHLADFPEMGVLREETLLGKHGFRALFIDQYACIYKIEGDIVYIYHLVDARRDYIYEIFGMKG